MYLKSLISYAYYFVYKFWGILIIPGFSIVKMEYFAFGPPPPKKRKENWINQILKSQFDFTKKKNK